MGDGFPGQGRGQIDGHVRPGARFPVTMGMFHNLMSKIFAHGSTPVAATTPSVAGGTGGTPAPTPSSPAAGGAQPPSSAPAASAATVDVTAILNDLAAKNPEHLDWKRSIVDLMKLVGMDSSLSARKELADDLHYPGDKNDSATMNEWLHKEVLKKLADNGGKVPAELLG